jgi:processive 1,2-diacylglycerol beta-glucosyltransferase
VQTTPSPRVIVLTAGYGEGHNAAARAVAAACDEREGPGTARVADVFALASPRMNRWVSQGYLFAINRTPWLWSRAYAWMDRSRLLARALDGGLLRRERAQLLRLLGADGAQGRIGARDASSAPKTSSQPVLCSTYPAYSFMVGRLKREGRIAHRHYSVVTDSISINSLWWKAGCDGWFVPNADSAEPLRHAGIDPERVWVSGFPVNLYFTRHAKEFAPADLGGGAAPKVLYIINSGTRGAEEIAARLLAEEGWDVTLAVGRDEALRKRLEKRAAGRRRPTEILGWTDAIPRLLLTHHAVVSKAGGATTQEAIAARCPMIVNQIVPGQEEGNYELLRRHGIGGLAETPAAIARTLQEAFADGGRVWSGWRERLKEISRPDAARAIATVLLKPETPGPPPAIAQAGART